MKRRKFDPEFREVTVRVVSESGKTVAEDLGINETTLASWVSRAQGRKERQVRGHTPPASEGRPPRFPAPLPNAFPNLLR
ncbi:transposase [Streptomyces justiciae]|uniref:Transposase n=1 Tax=Streptomyces justiciae TaxID=2780140 RepID=A0ABU3LM82_9ACTN|nr:transposase [Streptomyces justiciae]MDT7840173.1 transposase [Streptomyces justiciae]